MILELACAAVWCGALLPQEPSTAPSAKQVVLRGRVVDEDGRPIAGAGVLRAAGAHLTTETALRAPQVRSGEDGRFELVFEAEEPDSAANPLVLVAAAGRQSGFLNTWPLGWGLTDERRPSCGDVCLPRGVTLRATIRQQGGEPVAGAIVTVQDVLQSAASSWNMVGPRVTYASRGVTTEKGLVELPGVSAEGGAMHVEAAGFHDASLPFVTRGDALVVELSRGGFAEGRVVDALGRPCTAWVWTEYERDENGSVAVECKDGSFRINLCRGGRYRVYAQDDTYTVAAASSALLDAPAAGLELRLQRVSGKAPDKGLLVRVTDAETGKPVEQLTAAARWDGSGDLRDSDLQWSSRDHDLVADVPGEIRLPGPNEGEETEGVVIVRAKATHRRSCAACSGLPPIRRSSKRSFCANQ